MKTVYLLGAGFSYAASRQMPLMASLSAEIAKQLQEKGGPEIPYWSNFREDFEALLTFLYSAQPWQTRAESLRNQAGYYEVAEKVADIIRSAQSRAFSDKMPDWLPTLILQWEKQDATVITFNYDEIVERSTIQIVKDTEQPQARPYLYAVPLPNAFARDPAGLIFGSQQWKPFTLLKLHGSVNWYYSGEDAPFNDTVYSTLGINGWWDSSASKTNDDRLIDKQPFIIPPTAIKNSFYNNDILRAQWKMARYALNHADELYILGYSAPKSDLLVRALIGTEFRGRKLVCVTPDASTMDRITEYQLPGMEFEKRSFPLIENYMSTIETALFSCINCRGTAQLTYADLCNTSPTGHCPLCPAKELQVSTNDTRCHCCGSAWNPRSHEIWNRGGRVEALSR